MLQHMRELRSTVPLHMISKTEHTLVHGMHLLHMCVLHAVAQVNPDACLHFCHAPIRESAALHDPAWPVKCHARKKG